MRQTHVTAICSAVSGATGLAACRAEATDRATCAVDLGGAAPEWIQLMPLGEIRTRMTDSRQPWKLVDAAAVIRASQAVMDKLPIDYDHQTDFTRETGNAAPAAGWITELEAREDGIYGRVEWTEKGAAAIAAREYRFISPVFTYDKKTREVGAIIRAGLVNDPALFLKALASSQATPEEDQMDKLLKQLRQLLGLAEDADEKAVCAAVEELKGGTALASIAKAAGLEETATRQDIEAAVAKAVSGKKGDVPLIGIAKALGLEEDATVEAIETAAAKATAAAAKAGDRDELAERLARLEEAGATSKAEASADAAIKEGKIVPAQRDWAVGLARKDPEAFESFLSSQPVIVKPGQDVPSRKPKSGDGSLDDEDVAVARAMGLDPAAYRKTRDEEVSQ